jgi:pyrroline-5-carboxylate reductase
MGSSDLGRRQIGFVGGGNMAEALVRGLLSAGVTSAAALRVSDPLEARRDHLTELYGIQTTADNAALAAWADLLVLAVKPQSMAEALAMLSKALRADALVVSIAAGVPTATIEAGLKGEPRVIRAMPNAAAMALAAATAIAAGAHARAEDLAIAQALFESVGRAVAVKESALDAVTGLSGSGPAYVMLVIEALADGGVKVGLPRDVAMMLASQTVYGAAKLQLESGEHPAVWKDRVSSPGGTTIAGLARLEARGVRSAFVEAVEAASARSSELGR